MTESGLVKCIRCKENYCCKDCWGDYFLINDSEAKCPSCDAVYSEKEISQLLGNKWLTKKYLPKLRQIWLTTESGKLEQTKGRIKKEKLIKKRKDELTKNIAKIRNEMFDDRLKIYSEIDVLEAQKIMEIEAINAKYAALNTKVHQKYGYYKKQRKLNEMLEEVKPDKDSVKKVNFLTNCPVPTCEGAIRSSNRKCFECETKICSKCWMIEKEEHECKPEDVKSVELIRTDSKTCPKCKTHIQKISGCDQIWCTNCRTAFNWRTGKIMTGRIHNPHYFDFLQNRGQVEHGDAKLAVGGLPDMNTIFFLTRFKVNLYNSIPVTYYEYLRKIWQKTAELDERRLENKWITERLYAIRKRSIEDGRELSEYNKPIYTAQRNWRRKVTEYKILRTYFTLLSDEFKRIVKYQQECPVKDSVRIRELLYRNQALRIIPRFEEIRLYINELLIKEMKFLGSSSPTQISSDFKFTTLNRLGK